MPPLERDENAEGESGNPAAEGANEAKGAIGSTPPAGKSDSFAAAFKSAQVELGEVEPDKKTAPKKPAAKPEEKPEPKAKKPADKAEQPDPKKAEKPQPKADDKKAKEEGEDGDDDPDGDGPKPSAPLKARRTWSARRQQEFEYLPRDEQQAWLSEPIEALANWDADTKAAFETLPEVAKEEMVYRSRMLEQGYQKKFEALATERKQLEAIDKAIPPRVRNMMQGRNIDTPTAFKALVGLQDFAMADPVGYVADFITRGKVDLNAIAERLGDPRPAQRQQQPANIESHPLFQEMRSKLQTLESQLNGHAEREQTEAKAQIDQLMTARDDAGELRYPFARLLSDYMADTFEDEQESFAGLSQAEIFDRLYKRAVAAHPELRPLKTQKKSSADEQEEDERDPDEERTAKLKAAQTRKSKTPHTAPGGRSRDPFDAAYKDAARRTGHG